MIAMSDIEVGAQVLGYADRITGIMLRLAEGSANARQAARLVADEGSGVYAGRAFEEIHAFVNSYADNVDKLAAFESVARQFLLDVVTKFHFTDEQLVQVLTIMGVDQP